jgi:biopolymer transport protein ExbB
MSVLELLTHGDGVSRSVAALLLAMSIASWVVILWKAWLLARRHARRAAQHRGVLAVGHAGRCRAEAQGIRPGGAGACRRVVAIKNAAAGVNAGVERSAPRSTATSA